MFDDCRGKKIVLIAHCALNQNAKLDKCAHCPGAIDEVVHVLLQKQIGMIQMPCPELLYLGLDRETDHRANNSVEAEDTRIYKRMLEPKCNDLLSRIVADMVHQVKEYQKHGFTIVGLIGINGSPTCGVETTWYDDQDQEGKGLFIEKLHAELLQSGIHLPMKGIRSKNVPDAVQQVLSLIE